MNIYDLPHWERMKNHKASRIARGFKWVKKQNHTN